MATQDASVERRSRRHLLDVAGHDWRSLHGLLSSASAMQQLVVQMGAVLGAAAMIGVLCHILMDFPTSYGTRLLSPFDWHWFATGVRSSPEPHCESGSWYR